MDLTQAYQSQIQDFFEQSRINNLILPIENETHKYYDEQQQIFKFSNERAQRQFPPQDYTEKIEEQRQQNQQEDIDINQNYMQNHLDSHPLNPIDQLLLRSDSSHEELMNQVDMLPHLENSIKIQDKQTYYQNEESITTHDLENIISFLVEYPNNAPSLIHAAISQQFPQFYRFAIVKVLMEKFAKLKKTKEQLIKYCMRKAFKFILELPKNQHILDGDKRQKYSFSKCKNKYLKRVSEQKSMNNKFLQQIFSECDFKRDYVIFLEHFEQIMLEDNQKKIKYLAVLLTNKDGKVKNVEMVKRLPWTKAILDKVLKISKELLRFSEETHTL